MTSKACETEKRGGHVPVNIFQAYSSCEFTHNTGNVYSHTVYKAG